MDEFWQSAAAADPGLGWELFSPVHFIWLAICAALTTAAAFTYRMCGGKGRKIFRLVIAVLLLVNLVSDQIFLIVTEQWTLFNLPLHMCCFGSYVIMAHAFMPKDNKTLAGLVYALALPGAILAMLTPNWSNLPVVNFAAFQSWFFHIMMIMYAVMLLAGGYVPSFVHIRKAIIPMLLVITALFVLNKLIDTDFLFMNGGKSVIWVSMLAQTLGIYGYLFIFPTIMALLWTAMFLPFDLHRLKKLKKTRQHTIVMP